MASGSREMPNGGLLFEINQPRMSSYSMKCNIHFVYKLEAPTLSRDQTLGG